jgi:hypothetical protein
VCPHPAPCPALAALLLVALVAPGCARDTTAPAAPWHLRRALTVVLTDSLGAPVADQAVTLVSLVDVAGIVPTLHAATDASGRAAFVVDDGPWAAAADPLAVTGPPARRLVAGATFRVPDASHPSADTVLVRLLMHTSSRVGGTTLLGGQSDHRGTSVSTVACPASVASTDADGRWSLDDVPPGRWSFVMSHGGYATTTRTAVVPAPGSAVSLPAVQLPGPTRAPH